MRQNLGRRHKRKDPPSPLADEPLPERMEESRLRAKQQLARQQLSDMAHGAGSAKTVTSTTLIEIIQAAHMSNRVRSRFEERGGIFLIAPPGHVKTTLLAGLSNQMGVYPVTDFTTRNLVNVRDLITSNKVSTILLYDLQKVYERRLDTATNIMGNLRALMAEGFTMAANEEGSTSLNVRKARAVVIAALTPQFFRRNVREWEDNGIKRRILEVRYQLERPEQIQAAVLSDTPIELTSAYVSMPANLMLNSELGEGDDTFLMDVLGWQTEAIPLILMRKILIYLRWKYGFLGKDKTEPRRIISEFGNTLRDGGANLIL